MNKMEQNNRKTFTKLNKRNVPLSCLIVLLLLPASQAQNIQSPCPDVLQYDTVTSTGRLYGNILLTSDTEVQLQSLLIVFDKKVDVFVNWYADVTTADNMNFVLKNSKTTIYPDQTTTIKFFVNFNVMKPPTPKIKRIVFNGVDICNVDNPAVVIKKRIRPEHSDPSSSSGEESGAREQCGKVVKENINELIVRGSTTTEGQWPWHAALFQSSVISSLVHNTYFCGGSLVSHYHVITAGHCVTKPRRGMNDNQHPRPLKDVNSLTVYLGKHNLIHSVDGVQIRLVSHIIRHPDYFHNTSLLQRDLAIIRLRERVNYTPWVQPVCLWPDDQTSLSNVVGKRGSVVGWGQNENGDLNTELSLAQMPVVTGDTCRQSLPSFYGVVTSDYTYCAGGNRGPSVCNGDSGGGMVFKIGDVWSLRGVVSLSKSLEHTLCDPDHYVVFTDLAKFLPWIKQNMT